MPHRVLIVDDSAVVRRLVSDVVAGEDDFEVIGVAANGAIALEMIAQLAPDIVTLDVEMPVLDGLATLAELRRLRLRPAVVMLSTMTERGAQSSLRALELGADDYVTKPTDVTSLSDAKAMLRAELVPKLRAISSSRRAANGLGAPVPSAPARIESPAAPTSLVASVPRATARRFEVVVVGASTGGPEAVTRLLEELPADFPLPVLVVLHMPAVFTAQFAARLDGRCALHVTEAAEGDQAEVGRVLIAPGGRHLGVSRIDRVAGPRVVVRLDDGPLENFVRPAVDVLFRTAVAAYGAAVLGVVLTGMGQDGAVGARQITDAGGVVLAQDEASSVVWGMPGAVVAHDAASQVVPLSEMALTVRALTVPVRRGVAGG